MNFKSMIVAAIVSALPMATSPAVKTASLGATVVVGATMVSNVSPAEAKNKHKNKHKHSKHWKHKDHHKVPEIDGSQALLVISLLTAAGLIVREKSLRTKRV